MSGELSWEEVAVRLALTVVAGGLIGYERGERGRPAGLRTHILVCVAAAVAMLQVDLLLGLRGRGDDSFISIDVMRLPLGILSGMGFIGGGVILRRGDLLVGVTTAATLWFVTVMGLCFGGGQIGLGLSMFGVGLVTLSVMGWGEKFLKQDRHATLTLSARAEGPSDRLLREEIMAAGFTIAAEAVKYLGTGTQMRFTLLWRARPDGAAVPALVQNLAARPGIRSVAWRS